MHGGMDFEQEFRKRLKDLRDARKLTQISELSGVEQSRLSKIVTHNQSPGLDKVSKILDALGAIILFPDQQGVHESLPALRHSPYSDNLPATIQHPDNLPAAMEKIAYLERKIVEQDQQLSELIQYKHRWEGVMDLRKMEAEVQAQARICGQGRDHDPPDADSSGEG